MTLLNASPLAPAAHPPPSLTANTESPPMKRITHAPPTRPDCTERPSRTAPTTKHSVHSNMSLLLTPPAASTDSSDPIRASLQNTLRSLPPGDSAANLIRSALSGTEDFPTNIENLLLNLFPRNKRARVQDPTATPTLPPPPTTRSAARKAAYKKAQDLYKRDRRGLADSILSGRSLDAPAVRDTGPRLLRPATHYQGHSSPIPDTPSCSDNIRRRRLR